MAKPSGPLGAVLHLQWHYPSWKKNKKNMAFRHVVDTNNSSLLQQTKKIGVSTQVSTSDMIPFRADARNPKWETELGPLWKKIVRRSMALSYTIMRASPIILLIGKHAYTTFKQRFEDDESIILKSVDMGLSTKIYQRKASFYVAYDKHTKDIKHLIFYSYHTSRVLYGSSASEGVYADFIWNTTAAIALISIKKEWHFFNLSHAIRRSHSFTAEQRAKGHKTQKELGYPTLKKWFNVFRQAGFPNLKKGRQVHKANGHPNLRKFRDSQRKKGWPVLKKARAVVRANGFAGLRKGYEYFKANNWPNLRKGTETLRGKGYPNLKKGYETNRASGWANVKKAREAQQPTIEMATKTRREKFLLLLYSKEVDYLLNLDKAVLSNVDEGGKVYDYFATIYGWSKSWRRLSGRQRKGLLGRLRKAHDIFTLYRESPDLFGQLNSTQQWALLHRYAVWYDSNKTPYGLRWGEERTLDDAKKMSTDGYQYAIGLYWFQQIKPSTPSHQVFCKFLKQKYEEEAM